MGFEGSHADVTGRHAEPRSISSRPAQEPQDTDWYLAQLKPSGFERAKINLARQGYETFMPVQEISRRRCGRLSLVIRPLFPGYLFVQIPPSKRDWRAINSTFGIARLVALQNGRPTEVPSDLISALRARTDPKGHLRAPDNLVVGEQVRVIDGPFAQHVAEIEAVVPGDRVVLLMQLMGRLVRTKIAPGALEVL